MLLADLIFLRARESALPADLTLMPFSAAICAWLLPAMRLFKTFLSSSVKSESMQCMMFETSSRKETTASGLA